MARYVTLVAIAPPRSFFFMLVIYKFPGKNCQGGIGSITEGPYEDSSGDACYTVRFTVGSTEKFIEVDFISPYSFGEGKRRKRGCLKNDKFD